MFKRPKGNDESPPTQASTPDSTSGSDPAATTSESDAMKPATPPKATIPVYETRKPAVRTLQSSPSAQSSQSHANLHVGRGLKLEGKIQSCDSLVIEGDVEATIESGTLTVSDTGEVKGEATVDNAEINGKFDGTLTVRGCLTINSTGRVTGTVRYGELKVEQGGQISGEIQAEGAGSIKKPATGDSPVRAALHA